VCERERGRKRERVCACVCVCVYSCERESEKERACVCVCLCLCVWEREIDKKIIHIHGDTFICAYSHVDTYEYVLLWHRCRCICTYIFLYLYGHTPCCWIFHDLSHLAHLFLLNRFRHCHTFSRSFEIYLVPDIYFSRYILNISRLINRYLLYHAMNPHIIEFVHTMTTHIIVFLHFPDSLSHASMFVCAHVSVCI